MKKLLRVFFTLTLLLGQTVAFNCVYAQDSPPPELIKHTNLAHPDGAVTFEWYKPSDAPTIGTKYIILRSTDKSSYREIANLQDQTYYVDFIDESKYKSIKYKITAEFTKYNSTTDTDEIQNRESADIYAKDVYMQIKKVEFIGSVYYIEWSPPELEDFMGYKIYCATQRNEVTGDFIGKMIVTEPSPLPKHYYYYNDHSILEPDKYDLIAYQIQTSDFHRKSDWFIYKDTTTNSGLNIEVDPIEGTPTQPYIDPATTPMINDNNQANLPFIQQAVENSGSSFDITGFIKDLFSNLTSPGSNVGYNQELPQFYAVPDIFNQIGITTPGESQEELKKAYDEAIANGSTQGEFVDQLARQRELNLLYDKVKLAQKYQQPVDDYIITEEGVKAADDMQKWINQTKGGGASGPGGSGTTEDASESAGYFTKVLKQINPINIDAYQCKSNTGIFCVLENIIRLALTLAGLIAVAFIIYGGYLYITSAGNPEGSKAGIAAVTNAAIGLVIVLAAWIIINTVLTVLSKGSL